MIECPECGSGVVSREETGVTIRLPRGYPFDRPCKTCAIKSREAMQDLGRQAAEKLNQTVVELITGAS